MFHESCLKLCFYALYVTLCISAHTTLIGNRPPVILVPGDGGSQFEARLDKNSTVHRYCYKKSDWYTLWLSVKQAMLAMDCLIDNMRLQYDIETRTSRNQQGVDLRQPQFGNTSSVEWLDPTHPVLQYKLSYYHDIVETLVSKLNYTRGLNVLGAPYDFRKAPNEMEVYFNKLTALVEKAYRRNGNSRVVVVGHSMGNLFILYWLNRQPLWWKDKFLRSWISLGSPWGGSVKPLRLMASGDALGARLLFNPLKMRALQRSLMSTAFLMPYNTFWNDEVLVYGPRYNYTVNDYRRFFSDIGFPEGYFMRNDTENLIKDLKHPEVETHCLYGSNVTTPEAFRFTVSRPDWMDHQPQVIHGDGDGTVNKRSLMGCRRWVGGRTEYPVYVQQYNHIGHVDMLSSRRIIDYILQVLKST